jgi:hypothetical protein
LAQQVGHVEHTGYDQDRHDYHQPTHCRGTYLGFVAAGAIDPYLLSNAPPPEQIDQR